MILGCGIDVIEIVRIENMLERFPERFINRLCTPLERRPQAGANYYAKRFSGKEATLKAMGFGLQKGLTWHDIEITSSSLGQPLVTISRAAEELVRKRLGLDHGRLSFHISLCDTKEYAQAMVILEHMGQECTVLN
jgi:holo-[acyl-carrier protein] synthase